MQVPVFNDVNANKPVRRTLIPSVLSVCLVVTSVAGAAPPNVDADHWIDLFNGKDLTGWVPKITGHPSGENVAHTFRVEGNLLKVRYDEYERFDGRFGHLFFERPFSHYALSVTYRFVGEQLVGGPRGWAVRNSGVMLHAQEPHSMSLKQDFPISIEAQFLGGLGNDQPRPTANVCTPGTHIVVERQLFTPHCLNSTSATFDGDQWVTVTVVVLGGGSVTHYVNGTEVLKYHRPQLGSVADGEVTEDDASLDAPNSVLGSGYIALQSESHPIDFKAVRLLDLSGCMDPNATNFRPYLIASKPASCRYE